MKLFLACMFTSLSAFSINAFANGPTYDMRSTTTDIWRMDADYFAQPITLVRSKNTFPIHTLNFEVLRYIEECVQWGQVCVKYDASGRCVQYEYRCVQMGYRTEPVSKQIGLNFRDIPTLVNDETETYEVTIQRSHPAGSGEDWVTTWFRDVKTKIPVRVQRMGDYQYDVAPKN